ncbi:conserved hypothetical protein [Delftia acidovorans SPH-1]|uniref:DUF6651 domain-containing protein n=1 Tax=Delftia acidovorans (strain DSM 14801 / SPH-1) TaxID=398578 RepID=A9BW62_DELAS|nr:DUF6651 domain-containing protein [Delftia acidovorans]ABX35878.1 conserved hypothetical protein [Delftia acidovorans SPH-1]QPS74836.1 hypothetical protein I6G48_30250 [Delftia acidovorans]
MKLKLDSNGAVVLQDGAPVYIKDDGTEIAFDGAKAFAKIGELTGQSAAYRKRFEDAESKLKGFEGIADPDAARKALETLQSLDQKKLIDAGEVEKVKAEISKAFQAQLDAANGTASKLEQQLYAEMIGGSFARSKFALDKLAIPPDLVQAYFGKAFSIEEGKVVAKDANGNKLYSAASPGDLAGFDEALEMLVNQYPGKDHILKGSGASGSGAQGGHGGGKQQGNFGGSKAERVAAMKQLTSGA